MTVIQKVIQFIFNQNNVPFFKKKDPETVFYTEDFTVCDINEEN